MEVLSGRIFFVDLEKKFGFIKPLEPTQQLKRVHFHLRDCEPNFQVTKGALVQFRLSSTEANHAASVFTKTVCTKVDWPPPLGDANDKKKFHYYNDGKVLHIRPADRVPELSNLDIVEGVIAYMNAEREFGKIKPREGGGQVTFLFTHVINRSNQDLIVRIGIKVLFVRNLKIASKAFRVFVGEPLALVCGHPWKNSEASNFHVNHL
jgi:hypothetical protein